MSMVTLLENLAFSMGKGGVVAAIARVGQEGDFSEFSSVRDMMAKVNLRKNPKTDEAYRAARNFLYACWVHGVQGVDAESALDYVTKLGGDTVITYNGDVSAMSFAVAEKEAAAESRRKARAAAGKTDKVVTATVKLFGARMNKFVTDGVSPDVIAAAVTEFLGDYIRQEETVNS